MGKDWTGNRASVFKTLGASNHSLGEREKDDYYATEPKATEWLLKLETFNSPILEPSCGEGHISEVLINGGCQVVSRDLIDRGYGEVADFLSADNTKWDGDIITNPPYKYAQEFVEKALQIIPDGCKVAMFLKVQYLEGKRRRKMFDTMPPKRIWVSSSRLKCAINGDFDNMTGSATAYAWFIWEKGFHGDTIIKWFN
nr:hypothetical protein [uncultured Prevotella sp.]